MKDYGHFDDYDKATLHEESNYHSRISKSFSYWLPQRRHVKLLVNVCYGGVWVCTMCVVKNDSPFCGLSDFMTNEKSKIRNFDLPSELEAGVGEMPEDLFERVKAYFQEHCAVRVAEEPELFDVYSDKEGVVVEEKPSKDEYTTLDEDNATFLPAIKMTPEEKEHLEKNTWESYRKYLSGKSKDELVEMLVGKEKEECAKVLEEDEKLVQEAEKAVDSMPQCPIDTSSPEFTKYCEEMYYEYVVEYCKDFSKEEVAKAWAMERIKRFHESNRPIVRCDQEFPDEFVSFSLTEPRL